MKHRYAALFLSLALPPAQAFSQADSLKIYSSDETVVTATMQESPPENVPQPTTIITRTEIENSMPYNVGDLLDFVPGVSVFRTGGSVGGNNGVSIRSLNGGPSSVKTLVLLDGRPVNDAWNGGVNWLSIPSEQVERVEVVRGPGSALYGSRSSGGVISVFTRKSLPGFHGWFSLGREFNASDDISKSGDRGFGRPEAGASQYALNGSYAGEKSSHFVSFGYRDADQEFPTPNKNKWNDYDGLYKVKYSVSENLETGALVEAHSNTWKSRAAASPGEDKDAYYTGDFSVRWQTGTGVFNGRVYVNNTGNDNTVYSSNLKTGTNATRTGLMLDYTLALSDMGVLTAGFDGNYNHADVDYARTIMNLTSLGQDSLYVLNTKTGKYQGYRVEKFSGTYGSKSQSYDEHNLAVFAQYTRTFIEKLNVVVGGRVDSHSEFGTVFNPKAGVTWDILQHGDLKTTLKANFGTAFRAPTMWSLYSKATGSYGDPDLKPEKTRNYDAGIFQRLGKFGLAEVTFYKMNVTDLLINANAAHNANAFYVFVQNGANTDTTKFNRQMNLGNYNPLGVELGYTVSPNRFINIKGAYTYLDPGDFTYQTSKNRFNIDVSGYTPLGRNRIEGEVTYNFTGNGYFYDYESSPHASFAVSNARLSFCYGDGYRISLSVMNFTDTKYQYSPLEWQVGRTTRINVESRF